MSSILHSLKGLVAWSASRVGYRIERIVDAGESALDVFELAVRHLNCPGAGPFRFVQVGANDGVFDDPIRRYVEEYHWPGILVEPQPGAFARLRDNYRGEPQLIFENAAIADRDGTATLYIPGAGTASVLASFDREGLRRRLGPRVPIREVPVPALTPATLLARHRVRSIDLLQVDAEGYDFEVIKQFDAAGVRPALIRFEHYHLSRQQRRDCLAFLAARGYRLHRDRTDIIALHADALHADAPRAGRPGQRVGAAGPA
jgi:FkbM family methyltransferase